MQLPEGQKEWREILFLPQGVYRVDYHKLNIRSLKNHRSRLITENGKIRRKLASLRRQIEDLRVNLQKNESMLGQLTTEKLDAVLEIERERQRQAQEKANQFLKNYIGEKPFKTLQEKGEFVFIGGDGKEYRIKKDASLWQSTHGYWYKMCVIHPKDLPLPDIIASVFTTVKNDPTFSKRSVKARKGVLWR